MKQVAGIQAVNAEGNVIGTLSVDDLTELVAANIVQSTKKELVSAQSAVLAETSTLAATDEYEDQLALDTNPAYVRSLDTNGNPKRTAIASLASVVGGLLGVVSQSSNGLATGNLYKAAGVSISVPSDLCLKIERNKKSNSIVLINVTAFNSPTWSTTSKPRKVLLSIPYDSGEIGKIYAKNLLDGSSMKIYKDENFNLYIKCMDTYSTAFFIEIIQGNEAFSKIYSIPLSDVPNIDKYEQITIN